MKRKLPRALCLVLALVMILSLCACGETDQVEAGKRYDFGDYEVVYKSACIMPNDEGKDSFVVYFDFTNNSDSAASYGWTIFEKVTQGDAELDPDFVLTNLETYDYIGETSFNDVEPGSTVEVSSSYELDNTTDQIKLNISDLVDRYSYNLIFDPSELEHVEPQNGGGVSTSDDEIGGETQGFGDFVSVLVPEGYTFERDSWNEDNPHYVSIERSDWVYFNLHNYTTEEEMTTDYNYVKKTYTNEQVDVSATYGDIDWIGFQYGDGFGGYCFEFYAIIGSNYLRVDSAGLAFDDPIAVAVLGSIVMASQDTGSVDPTVASSSEVSDDSFLSWWAGDWYGWWIIAGGTGDYADAIGYWWDICAQISIDDDLNGEIVIWDDDDRSADIPCCVAQVSFNEAGLGEHGTMMSESGAFLDHLLEHADWIVDPGLEKLDDLIWIDGSYDTENGSISYEMFLRPWGVTWDDMTEEVTGYEDSLPNTYDWYMSFVNAGLSMPDSFDATASGGTSAPDATDASEETTTSVVPTGNMIPFSVDGETFYGISVPVNFSLPEGTWDMASIMIPRNIFIYNCEDGDSPPFGVPQISISLYDTEKNLNAYVDQYENLSETEGRTIGGIEMQGRKYDYTGYKQLQEYWGLLPNGVGISIRLIYMTEEALPECYAILDTMHFD